MTPQQRKESKIEREKRNLDTFRSASFIEACKRGGVAAIPDTGEPPVAFPKFDF